MNQVGSKPSYGSISFIEEWLEKAISSSFTTSDDFSVVGINDYDPSKGTRLHSLGLDKESLQSLGCDGQTQDSIYRALYVHIHGIHETILGAQRYSPLLPNRLWDLCFRLFQYHHPHLREAFLSYLTQRQDTEITSLLERQEKRLVEYRRETAELLLSSLKSEVKVSSLSHIGTVQSMHSEVKIKYLEEQVKSLQEESDKLREAVAASRGIQSSILESCEQLQTCLSDLAGMYSEVSNEKRSLTGKLNASLSDCEAIRAKWTSQEELIQKLRQENNLLREDWSKTSDELREANTSLARARQDISVVSTQRESSDAELLTMRANEEKMFDALQAAICQYNALQKVLLGIDKSAQSFAASAGTVAAFFTDNAAALRDITQSRELIERRESKRSALDSLQLSAVLPPSLPQSSAKSRDISANERAQFLSRLLQQLRLAEPQTSQLCDRDFPSSWQAHATELESSIRALVSIAGDRLRLQDELSRERVSLAALQCSVGVFSQVSQRLQENVDGQRHTMQRQQDALAESAVQAKASRREIRALRKIEAQHEQLTIAHEQLSQQHTALCAERERLVAALADRDERIEGLLKKELQLKVTARRLEDAYASLSERDAHILYLQEEKRKLLSSGGDGADSRDRDRGTERGAVRESGAGGRGGGDTAGQSGTRGSHRMHRDINMAVHSILKVVSRSVSSLMRESFSGEDSPRAFDLDDAELRAAMALLDQRREELLSDTQHLQQSVAERDSSQRLLSLLSDAMAFPALFSEASAMILEASALNREVRERKSELARLQTRYAREAMRMKKVYEQRLEEIAKERDQIR